MKMFSTTVKLPDFLSKITLQTPILSLGSCFAHHISSQLQDYKFQVWNNPFGILFNPMSIFKTLRTGLENNGLNPNKIIQNQEIWSHYDTHSKLSALSLDDLNQNINLAQHQMSSFWNTMTNDKLSGFLILTFGTAYVHRLKTNQEIVANCHKMSAHLFDKELLSTSQVIDEFDKIYNLTPSKDIQIVLTVSPVRHIKETLSGNQVSKSILRLVCHELQNQYPNVHYFPAYEIMIDELRDYRFYDPDLIHPNQMAIQYIFEKFSSSLLDEETRHFMSKWRKIRIAMNHRPQFENAPSYLRFLDHLMKKIRDIHEVDTSMELTQIENKIQIILRS